MIVMKKKFSASWKTSTQPRKQRKYRHNAPMHLRQKLVSVHLSKDLRKNYGKRSIPVRILGLFHKTINLFEHSSFEGSYTAVQQIL